MSSSGVLACRFALRLAAPRGLAAALAAAAPSEDIPRLPAWALKKRAFARPFVRAFQWQPATRFGWAAVLRLVRVSRCAASLRGDAELRSARYRAMGQTAWHSSRRFCAIAVRDLVGRRVGMCSEGAAAASAAARRRGAASRKAKLQARAPEENSPARLTGDAQKTMRYGPTRRDERRLIHPRGSRRARVRLDRCKVSRAGVNSAHGMVPQRKKAPPAAARKTRDSA